MHQTATKTELIIAENSQLYLSALIRELKRYPVKIIGTASNGNELLELLKSRQPHIVILDLDMPFMSGDKAFEIIRIKYPAIKIFFLTHYEEEGLVENLFSRGTHAYVSKRHINSDLGIIAQGIKKLMKEEKFCPMYDYNNFKVKYNEIDIKMIPLIHDEKLSKEIGDQLQLSKTSIDRHLGKLYAKTGTISGRGLIKYIINNGLLFLKVIDT